MSVDWSGNAKIKVEGNLERITSIDWFSDTTAQLTKGLVFDSTAVEENYGILFERKKPLAEENQIMCLLQAPKNSDNAGELKNLDAFITNTKYNLELLRRKTEYLEKKQKKQKESIKHINQKVGIIVVKTKKK